MASAQEEQFTFLKKQLPEVEFHAWTAKATALKVPTLENEATKGLHTQHTLGLTKEIPEDLHELSLRDYVVDISRSSSCVSSCVQVQRAEVLERASSDAKKRIERRSKVMPFFKTIFRKIPLIKHCAKICLKL